MTEPCWCCCWHTHGVVPQPHSQITGEKSEPSLIRTRNQSPYAQRSPTGTLLSTITIPTHKGDHTDTKTRWPLFASQERLLSQSKRHSSNDVMGSHIYRAQIRLRFFQHFLVHNSVASRIRVFPCACPAENPSVFRPFAPTAVVAPRVLELYQVPGTRVVTCSSLKATAAARRSSLLSAAMPPPLDRKRHGWR